MPTAASGPSPGPAGDLTEPRTARGAVPRGPRRRLSRPPQSRRRLSRRPRSDRPQSRRRRSGRGWRRFAATLVGGLLAVFVAATLRLFVFPTTDGPARVDAIVLLGGVDGASGLSTALTLARAGDAPQLVVSTPGYGGCPREAIAHVAVTCFYPHPTSTQGEARAIGRLATERHWKRILVVTRRAQDTRTRLRVERCYPGQLLINTVSPPLGKWPYQLAYEWGALAKAVIWQRAC